MSRYFAYGSNLDPNQMKNRCPASRVVGTAKLIGYRLAFSYYSDGWAGGVANVEKSEGSEVWGVIYELMETDLESLDVFEGHPKIYQRFEGEVVNVATGYMEPVWIYAVVDDHKTAPIKPSPKYLQVIQSAAERLNFPADYRASLRQF